MVYTGGNLTVSGSTFTGNLAIGGAGGSGGDGNPGGFGGGSGAVVWCSDNMTLSSSTFTGNVAIGGDGAREATAVMVGPADSASGLR